MAGVVVAGIRKSFGPSPVLDGVSLDVADGEFLSLLGPSGCGKSTLLRIIAGLEQQDSGSILIDGRSVDRMRPKERDIAMVFQSYALYPHMTVAQNLALPLRMRRLRIWQRLPLIGRLLPSTAPVEAEIAAEVSSTAEALEIAHLLDRKPGQLSGGQRQRVAVARAMVRHPAVFLMDEPLSNLDAKLRVQTRSEIKKLHEKLGATFIYVTHDQAEAMTLSDRVALLVDGKLLQVGSPRDLYADPEDRRVAALIGSPEINLIDAVANERGHVSVAGSVLSIEPDLPIRAPVTLGIRPEAFQLVERGGAGALTGKISLIEHLGSDLFVHVEMTGSSKPVVARLLAERAPQLHAGSIVNLGVKADRILVFAQDGRRLRPRPSVTRLRAS